MSPRSPAEELYLADIDMPVVTLRDSHDSLPLPILQRGEIAEYPKHIFRGDLCKIVSSTGVPLGFGFYEPDDTEDTAVRVFHVPWRDGPYSYRIAQELRRRLAVALSHRKSLGLTGDSTDSTSDGVAYRLVHSDADRLPGLIVDIYNRTAVLLPSSTAMARLRGVVVAWLAATALVDRVLIRLTSGPSLLYDKFQNNDDFPNGFACNSNLDGYLPYNYVLDLQPLSTRDVPQTLAHLPPAAVSYSAEFHEVFSESGVTFVADVAKGLRTGFFLDHRPVRRLLASLVESHGASRVLDLCCYTGAFGVTCGCAGASVVDIVDISGAAVQLGEHIWSLNTALRPELRTACLFSGIAKAALPFLKTSKTPRYDLVVIDPPNLAKQKHDVPTGIAAYVALLKEALEVMAPEGAWLVALSPSRHLQLESLRRAISAAGVAASRAVTIQQVLSPSCDFPRAIGDKHGYYVGVLCRVRDTTGAG